jgi:CHAD domain-containing protein
MQIHNGGKRILATHYSKFLEAKRRFDASQPHNEEALHEMRIALKKLRYATEAAHPLIVDTKKEHIETMRAFQKLMGDTRDLEILRVELEHWANQKGKKLAVIPAVRELEEKRQALLNELVVASHDLTRLMDSSAVRSNEPLIA